MQQVLPSPAKQTKQKEQNKKKRIALSQCIVQAARPRSVLAPVPTALGVSVEKKIGSKALVTLLFRHAFCVSADEVSQYKKSAAKYSCDELD